nr:hypothetical protein [Tanacetum cinerariifolium]
RQKQIPPSRRVRTLGVSATGMLQTDALEETAMTTRQPIYKSLYAQVIVAIIVGIALGHWYPETAVTLKPLGDGFIKLIKMVIAPIIFCTVVSGIAGMQSMKSVGKTGGYALLYFEIVSTISLIIGLIVVNVVQPGAGMNIDVSTLDASKVAAYVTAGKDQSIVGFILNVIPNTIVGAFANGDILQVLMFSVIFGFALHRLGAYGKPILDFIDRFAHLAGAIGSADAVLLHHLPAVRVGGAGLHRESSRLQHSQADQVHPRRAVDRAGYLVLRVGAATHADQDGASGRQEIRCWPGDSDRLTNTHMDITHQITLLLVLLLSSKGAAGVTGSGFIVLAATLSAVGHLPVAGLALILGIDRFMSEARALTNLCGNAVATLVVAKWVGELDVPQMQAELASGGRAIDNTAPTDDLGVAETAPTPVVRS